MEHSIQHSPAGNANHAVGQHDGKIVAAIDIGTTKVITLVGREIAGGKVHVLACSEALLSRDSMLRGEVLHEGNVRDAIAATLADVRERSACDVREVYVGVAGSSCRCIDHTITQLRANGATEITDYELKAMEDEMYHQPVEPGEKILHIAAQEYQVDAYPRIANPAGMPGKRLSANYRLFVGHEAPVDKINWCVRHAGLTLKQRLFKPLAPAQAVLSDDEKERGVAVVDMGGGTTSVVVYYDNIVRYAAIIPFGGNSITEDVRDGCGVLRRHAGAIKIQYGSCYSDLVNANTTLVIDVNGDHEPQKIAFTFLAGIIEARMEEIIEAVVYSIEQSGFADQLAGGLVFTGGGAMMQHLKEFATAKTGMPARIARPLHVTSDSPNDARQCSYATAVGLLLQGIAAENAAAITAQIATAAQTEKGETPGAAAAAAEGQPASDRKNYGRKPARKKTIALVGDLFKDFFKKDDGV